MEKIKIFILDFIFSSLEGISLLFSALIPFDYTNFKQTCYHISAMQYLGIIPIVAFVLFLSFQIIKKLKKYLKLLVSKYAMRLKNMKNRKNSLEKSGYTQDLKFNVDNYFNNQEDSATQKTYILKEIRKIIVESKKCPLTPKKVLNSEESAIYDLLKEHIRQTFEIFPQVPLRAFFCGNKESLTHYVVGGMYVDFLIINSHTKEPVCVIEYFGGGHYGDNETKRAEVKSNDELKIAIFHKANIDFIKATKEDLNNPKSFLERIKNYT